MCFLQTGSFSQHKTLNGVVLIICGLLWCFYLMFRFLISCGSVVEHCVSSAKGCGFNSQGTHILIKKKCIAWMHCKSLWIKASAKCKCKCNIWWRPFTAEDPLVSKWCNVKCLQIYTDEETNSYTSWMAWGWVHFYKMFTFWKRVAWSD